MITINGVTYRNLEEQVRFNQQNINTSATAIAAETERAKAAEAANATAISNETQQEPMPIPSSIISLVRKFQELKRLMMPIAKLLQMKPPVQQELNLILELMWMLILLQY
jgi:hypothetical protein